MQFNQSEVSTKCTYLIIDFANSDIQVVMSSHDALLHTVKKRGLRSIANPLLNPSMLCIEGTAAIVSGDIASPGTSTRPNTTHRPFVLVSDKHPSHNVQMYRHFCKLDTDVGPCIPEDSYLCTGLDLYLSSEPDLMTAMALVHSRIRRVFYQVSCPVFGALGSHYNIHSLRSLNHHFRVFKIGK